MRHYTANTLTGGVTGALDHLWEGDDLNVGLTNGDLATVITTSASYTYRYDTSSVAAESSPDVIKPDSNTGSGRWLLVARDKAAAFSDADLTAGVLTISHTLSSRYLHVSIFDDSARLIVPDEITMTDAGTVSVDLSSYGTLTGSWNYRISR